MRTITLLSTVLLAAALLTGCRTLMQVNNAHGEPTYVLERHLSHWEVYLDQPVDATYKATLAGLDDLGLKPEENQVDRLSGAVRGHLANGTAYSIELSWAQANVTLMTIHTGTASDDKLVLRIFDAIKSHLKS